MTGGRGGDTAAVEHERPARTRRWFRYTLPGASTAVAFACLSFNAVPASA